MRRVMFFPSPPNSGSMGSAIKCIGIAKELRSRGNEVAFVMGGSVADLIMREHFRVYQSPIPVAKMDIRILTVQMISLIGRE